MSVYQFKAAKRKRQVYCHKEPPLPIPIESINGLTASNARWHYYTGFLCGNNVIVKHSGDMQYLYSMGFFGEGNLSDRGLIGDSSCRGPKIISRRRYIHRLSWKQTKERLDGNPITSEDNMKEYEEICKTTCSTAGCSTLSDQESNKNLAQYQSLQNKADLYVVDRHKHPAQVQQSSEPGNTLNSRCEDWDKDLSEQQEEEMSQITQANPADQTDQEDDWSGEADLNFWGTCVNESGSTNVSQEWEKGSDSNVWSSENIKCDKNTKTSPYPSQKANSSALDSEILTDIHTEILVADKAANNQNVFESETDIKLSVNHPLQIGSYNNDNVHIVSSNKDELSNVVHSPDANKPEEYDARSLVNEDNGDFIVEDDSNDEDGSDIRKLRPGWRICRKIDPHPLPEYLQLTLQEAYFLSFGLGCLIVFDEHQNKLDLVQMWRLFCDRSSMFVPHYIAYHHFRSKGWVPKVGIKFGVDYTIYRQGPPFYHSSFSILIKPLLSDLTPDPQFKGEPLALTRLARFYRVTEQVNKELLLCNVIRPDNLTVHELNHPSCISKFKIKETVVKKWIPSEERETRKRELS